MKKTLIASLMVLAATSCNAAHAGGFFSQQDKQKHIILSGLVYGSSYAITLDYKKAMILTLGIGSMREAQKSVVDKGDVAADLIGGVAAMEIIKLRWSF